MTEEGLDESHILLNFLTCIGSKMPMKIIIIHNFVFQSMRLLNTVAVLIILFCIIFVDGTYPVDISITQLLKYQVKANIIFINLHIFIKNQIFLALSDFSSISFRRLV